MRIVTRYVFFFITSALVLLVPSLAHSQENTPPDGATIKSAQVSGIDTSKLSPGLNEDITKLVGTALDRQKLRELAARLEAEQPRYVAAVRVTPDPDGGARVVFVVARMRDLEPQGDINAKYLVEEVVIEGVKDTAITAEMRADQDALKGKPLDEEVAERPDDAAEVGLSQLQPWNAAPVVEASAAKSEWSSISKGPNSRGGCGGNRWKGTRSITPIRAGARSCH
jgi:hypothetical protein